MRIALFDGVGKFTNDLVEHWQALGHEVKKDKSLDTRLINWSDITFFDFCEGSAQRASHAEDKMWAEYGETQPQNKNIIVREHDIDAWVGQHCGVNWKWVNHVVFVADHIKRKVEADLGGFPPETNVHLIKHGVDGNRFTFRTKPAGNKIAWVCNINHHKNIELALQVMAENPSYELHVLGKPMCSWQKAYILHFVEKNNIKFFQTDSVPDVNEWLEDKDFILLTSAKEAFCFSVAEAMLKGIKPLIHRFYCAGEIWDEKYIWDRVSQVKPKLTEFEYNGQEYRDYILNNFPLDKMFQEYDRILFGK